MENKKDIGTWIQESMEEGTHAPKPSLWERLDQSLNERSKKRRRALWFWYGSTGVLLMVLLGWWAFSETSQPNIQTNTIAPVEVVETKEVFKKDRSNKSMQSISTTTSNDSVADVNTLQEGTQTTTTVSGQLDENNTQNTVDSAPISGMSSKSKKTTENLELDTFQVKTEHAYYNSDLNKTIKSTDKQMIDSLVQANKLKMAIKDSIARARARDSIKLNRTTNDTIRQE
ncbi:MAG: hypothetical protein R3359_11715 [Marinirhabdus sp.]|nr:hypothetical protein [Marinirhabdus sp.]